MAGSLTPVRWRHNNAMGQTFLRLCDSVERHCGPPKNQWDGTPAQSLQIEKKILQLPAFFRSVSSYETQLRPEAAMQLLQMLNTEAVLLSAYDLINSKAQGRIRSAIKKLRQHDSVVMVDSGNYESYRKHDPKWNRKKLSKALEGISFDYGFCFDNLNPSSTIHAIVKDVVLRTKADQAMAPHGAILPIIHIPTSKSGGFKTEIAAELFAETAAKLNVHFIAIPERELGSGLIEKAKVVWAIRQKLNEMRRYQPIHLLGTGNPLSVAVFAAVNDVSLSV